MNILLLSTYDSGGAATCAVRLLEALKNFDSNLTINLLTAADSNDESIHGFSGIQKTKYNISWAAELLHTELLRNKTIRRFSYSLGKYGVDISNHPLVKDADIIHIHWINHGFLSMRDINKLISTKKPVIFSLHDMWYFTGGCHYASHCNHYKNSCGNCFYLKHPKENDLSTLLLNKKKSVFTHSSNIQFITSSKWLLNCAKNSTVLKDHQVSNLATPVNTAIFRPIEQSIARKKWNLEDNKHIILFLAMNISDPRKGFTYLSESLNLLMKKSSDIEVIVVGKSTDELLEKVPFKTHSLGQLSNIDDIVYAYNAADVFVIPSLEDNLPNTIMESLSCSTPAVGFNTGGIPEMIDHKKNGYIAQLKDTQDLANGIEWTLQNLQTCNLAANSRKKAVNSYSYPVISRQYQELYSKMLSKTSQS